jgi:hypothetical protein
VYNVHYIFHWADPVTHSGKHKNQFSCIHFLEDTLHNSFKMRLNSA